jgi:glycosyltransferase involved in cell wall biosynthesis
VVNFMLDQITPPPACAVPVVVDQRRGADPIKAVRKVRVLHVVNGEHFAGAERVQSHLGRCLPKFSVAADFAFVKPGKFAQMVHDRDGAWGNGFDVAMSGRFDLRPAWHLCDLIGQYSYDLMHAHTPRTAVIAALASKLSGIPWIYHVHSPAARDSINPLANRINSWIEKQSLRGCLHQIAVSESLRLERVAGGAAEDHVSVVHNGVPVASRRRDCLPPPSGRWTLGMVALIRPRKGLEVLLEALRNLKQRGHDVALRCIGPFESTEYAAEIDARIHELGIQNRVQRIGFCEDVPAALVELDAMVLPSLFGEGLPMVVLEAMAAALPVIATRVEGTPEAITHGVEGLLAEPRDPASLTDAIESLITGKRDWRQMAEQAHTRHQRCFSDEAMAKGTAEVYRRLCRIPQPTKQHESVS